MLKVMVSVFCFLFSSCCFSTVIEYHLETQSRLGYHLVSPSDLSSHRHELESNNIIRFSNIWSLGAGLRAFVESAYASNSSRYPDPVRIRDSQDFILRDLYLQYKSGPITLRLGSQQIVWGEAFGFYYADLVNPKDFRDFGIGPLEKNRLHTPLVNFKWNFKEHILQLLYIPKPHFNKTPSIGSDFSFPFTQFSQGSSVTFDDERTLPIGLNNAEYGGRFSPSFTGIDLSLLYLNYFDRAPVYLSSTGPGGMAIKGRHLRMETFGVTLSLPVRSWVIRSELLFNHGKHFNSFVGQLDSFRADEIIAVLGLDYIVGDRWRMGIQISENYRTKSVPGALAPPSTQSITGHGSVTLIEETTLDGLIAYAPHDGGSLVELSYMIPLSKRIELLLAVDLFNGSRSSQFGLYRPASRGYVQIKTFLGNEVKL